MFDVTPDIKIYDKATRNVYRERAEILLDRNILISPMPEGHIWDYTASLKLVETLLDKHNIKKSGLFKTRGGGLMVFHESYSEIEKRAFYDLAMMLMPKKIVMMECLNMVGDRKDQKTDVDEVMSKQYHCY